MDTQMDGQAERQLGKEKEREREREIEKERQIWDRQRNRQTDRYRYRQIKERRERERESDKDRDRQRERERLGQIVKKIYINRQVGKQKDRGRGRERERERERDRERERESERKRHRQKETDRERERQRQIPRAYSAYSTTFPSTSGLLCHPCTQQLTSSTSLLSPKRPPPLCAALLVINCRMFAGHLSFPQGNMGMWAEARHVILCFFFAGPMGFS